MYWCLTYLRLDGLDIPAMLAYEVRLQYAPNGFNSVIFMVCHEMPQRVISEVKKDWRGSLQPNIARLFPVK